MIMNWIEVVSIFAAAIAVSFGAIGPALGEGGQSRTSPSALPNYGVARPQAYLA